MPRGVEHSPTPDPGWPRAPVLIAVMPRGVEHEGQHRYRVGRVAVLIAVMPRGVEHARVPDLVGGDPKGADSSDAERR